MPLRTRLTRTIAGSACALALTVTAAGSASAATEIARNGRTGSVAVVDTATSPGVMCDYHVGLDRSTRLDRITLRGPSVRTIVNSAADFSFTPSLVSVDYRVYQTLPGQQRRLVLSSVFQTNISTLTPVSIPDHAFDPGSLPAAAKYSAEVAVTWKSPDQRTTFGTRTLRYDFYRTALARPAVSSVKGACG